MKIMEKALFGFLIIWLLFGFMAAGIFFRARHNVEFKASPLAAIPAILLGPPVFFGFIEMTDKEIAQCLDDKATEIIRLRELNQELIRQKDEQRKAKP